MTLYSLFPSITPVVDTDEQFYISCAQVKVVNGGSTTPSPTAKLPGAIRSDDPGLNVNVSFNPKCLDILRFNAACIRLGF